jgi:hypothetical protein
VARILDESLAVERERASLVGQVLGREPCQGHQDGSPVRPAQMVRRALEQRRRAARVAAQLAGPCGTEQRGNVLGIGCQGLLELAAGVARIAEPLEPDVAELRREGRLLEGAHGKLRLELGHLEGELPLAALGVDTAKLGQGWPEGGVEARHLLVALDGPVELEAALLEHLTQAQGQARARVRVGDRIQIRRGKPPLVEEHQLVPVTAEEVCLLEGFEGDRIARIGLETFAKPLQVGVRQARIPFRGKGEPLLHRSSRGRA